MPGGRNNFDFLRLLAAGLVLVSHLYPLTGVKDDRLLTYVNSLGLGMVGISIFFVISGYLVMQSWTRDPDPLRYAARRALRIYPALVVVVLMTMFVLGPLVTSLPLLQYFQQPRFVGYLNVLLLFPMPYVLPGVFASNPLPGAVNGSLWTLPYEVTMYLLLALVALTRLKESAVFWVGITALLVFAATTYRGSATQGPTILFIGAMEFCYLGAFFFYGVAVAKLQERMGSPRLSWAAVFLALLMLTWQTEWSDLLRHLLLGYVVIAVGVRSTPWLSAASRHGDFSYGIYIYAFPVQQTLVHFGIGSGSVLLNLMYLVIITLVFAVLSWIFVERRALLLKPSKPGAAEL